jgi:hypothetical protein
MSITRVTLTGVLVSTVAACTGFIQGDPGTPPPAPTPTPTPDGSRQLDIMPRQQMDPAGGYTAETSIQTLGLYYGAYVSQNMIRTLATAPVVLGGNATTILDTFHFNHEVWDTTKPAPQAAAFLAWTKAQIESGVPVMYGVYASDAAAPAMTYDNVLPAIAISATTPAVFDGSDTLTSSDNDGGKVLRTTGTLPTDRAGCQKAGDQGGCVPVGVDYAVALLGITDAKKVTLPVNVKIDVDPEPNEAAGDAAVPVNATVVATGLTVGHSYSLLRYDDYTKVPTTGTAANMLASPYTQRYDFVASDVIYTFQDPITFQSDSATYYRCVPR